MARLRESTSVGMTAQQSMARLGQFLSSLRGKDGIARIRLRVPGDGPTRELSIVREVRVEARRTRGEHSLEDLVLIRWVPEGTGAFPTFEGILSVRANDGDHGSSIELAGNYTPPVGAAGQVFDAVIGHRIARTTAREFLKDVKRAIGGMP